MMDAVSQPSPAAPPIAPSSGLVGTARARRELLPRGRRHRDALPGRLPGDLASLTTGGDAVLVLHGPLIHDAGPGVVDLLGWDPRLCIGRTLREVFDDAWADVRELQDQAAAAVGHVAIQTDVRLVHVDGQDVWVDVLVADRPEERVSVVVLTDVGARHAAAQGLPDAAVFMDRAEAAMAVADADGHAVGVLVVEIDPLDEPGMRQVTAALGDSLRAGDVLAELAPTRFAVLLRDLDAEQVQSIVADVSSRILSAVSPITSVRVGAAAELPARERMAKLLAQASADLR